MLKTIFVLSGIFILLLIPFFPNSFAQGDFYSLSHFSAKGITSENSPAPNRAMWTIIDGDEGVIVFGAETGVTVIRLDVKPYHTCYDDANAICLDVTVTGGKNMQFSKVGDNAVLVFHMPDKQRISIMSGELEATGIDLDLQKFKLKKISKIIEEHKQESAIDKAKEQAKTKLFDALEIIKDSKIQQALVNSNKEFDNIADAYGIIDQRNEEWISAGNQLTPFMGTIIGNKVSTILSDVMMQDRETNQELVYEEIILTNAYGANVAQTGKTTDYKQWDEQWWILAKQNGVDFQTGYDESAGVNALDMSVRIIDDQGRFLGIIKFVINIDHLDLE